MDVFTKWFVIDLLKLLSRFGIVIVFFVAVMALQLFKPAYSFVDILLILAVGMIMGAGYIEAQKWISTYLEKQARAK